MNGWLFAGYSALFLVFFAYLAHLRHRTRKLEEALQTLQESLGKEDCPDAAGGAADRTQDPSREEPWPFTT